MKKALLLLALAVTGSAIAQTAPVAQADVAADSGLLGKRYVFAGFGYLDVNHSTTDGFGIATAVNVPVSANLDVGIAYNHEWVENNSDINANILTGHATYYVVEGQFRPFVRGEFGHAWTDAVMGGDVWVWRADVGTEYLVNDKLSLSASAGYSDSFESGDNHVWSGSVELSYWITPTIAIGGEFGLIEGGNHLYGVGAVFVF